MIAELAMAYVDALNTGRIPTILSAWDYMVSEENQRALRSVYDFSKKSADNIFKQLPVSNSVIESTKAKVFNKAEEMFSQSTMSGVSKEKITESLTKIKIFIEDCFKTVILRNNSLSVESVQKYFESNFRDVVRQNLRNDKYQCDEDYDKDLESFKQSFHSEFQGEDFDRYLEDILSKFNQRVYRDISSIKVRKYELELAAYKEKIKRSDIDMANLRDETLKERQKYNDKYDLSESERIKAISKAEVLAEKLKFCESDRNHKIEMWEEK